MDHQALEERQIPDRYLLGQLSEDEATLFEQHALYCPECQELLESTEALVDGLRTVAAEDAAAAGRLGILAWLARRSRAALVAGAAAMLLAVALPGVLLWQHAGRLGAQLADARRPSPASVLSLAAQRGADSEPSHRVVLGDRSASLVLALELDTVSAERYAVTLSDDEGRDLWTVRGLVPDHRDSLALTLPASVLAPGLYRLRADALPADTAGAPASAGRYVFRAVD